MSKTKVVLIAGLIAALPAMSGCAADEEPTGDELAGESELDGEASKTGKADEAGSTFTYYKVERDMRRCVYPLCGGYWVSRINRAYTQCFDGSWAERCYAVEADLGNTGFPGPQQEALRGALADEHLLVRGFLDTRGFGGDFGNMGVLSVSEIWKSGTDEPASGLFVKVSDSGVRCITAPCFNTYHEAKVNSYLHTDFSELDLTGTGADQLAIDSAFNSLYDDGLLVAGYRYWFYQGGWQKGRWATKFYERVKPEATLGACHVGGCSSQICSEEEGVVSTCEWRAEYACFADATCERQDNGKCGWTETAELTACLENPPTP